MFISDFVRALNDSLELNENVVKALEDILLSRKNSTTLVNTPPTQTEYFNQKGTSYLYGREPVAADMFDGEAGSIAGKTPYPVIENFDLGETPDVLNGRLADKIVTLSSINDTTKLVLGTLTGVLGEYDSAIKRNELASKSKTWKKFKIGEYWPMSDGFSFNSDNNSTSKKATELQLHETSKYAFIKLSPEKDVKFHYISIDVDVISDMDIPAIFVILDTINATDGDQFEFRVKFNVPSDYTSQVKWPEVLFFDGSDNSNGVPQPSIVKDYENNENQRNHSIKIDGVDYYYVTANTLPVAARTKYNLSDYDRVFVSAAELNGKIINHLGQFDSIKFDSLKGSKYLGYGILEDKYLKTYSNGELLITAETVEGIDEVSSSILSFPQQQQKFIRKNTLKSENDSITFGGIVGSTIFYGRPSSFFRPKLPDFGNLYDYSRVEYYADSLEGIDGNVPVQYNVKKFKGYIDNPDENGIIFEYELNPSTLNGNVIAVRLGHFESSIGLTIQFNGSNVIISYSGISTDNAITVTHSGPIRCLVGFIYTNDVLYATYTVKGVGTWKVPCSNGSYVETLLASRINNVSPVNTTKQKYLPETDVYDYWNPVISVVVDGSNATSEATVEVKNFTVQYNLRKEEFDSIVVQYSKTDAFVESDELYFAGYSSVRGVLDPIVLRPFEVRGFLCTVDAIGKNTYLSNKTQNDQAFNIAGEICFRTGFTYNAYKGKVYADSYLQYDPITKSKLSNSQKESAKAKEFIEDPSNVPAELTTLTEPSEVIHSTSINITAGTHELYTVPNIDEISELDTKQIDNITAKFGWKVTTYYQSIG